MGGGKKRRRPRFTIWKALFLLLSFRLDYGLASLRTGKESKEIRQVRA